MITLQENIQQIDYSELFQVAIPNMQSLGVDVCRLCYHKDTTDSIIFSYYHNEEKKYVATSQLTKISECKRLFKYPILKDKEKGEYYLSTYGVTGYAGLTAQFVVNYFIANLSVDYELCSYSVHTNVHSIKLLRKLGFVPKESYGHFVLPIENKH